MTWRAGRLAAMHESVTVYRYEIPDGNGGYARTSGWATERAIVTLGGRMLKLTALDVGKEELVADGHWEPPVIGRQKRDPMS